jgi:preprotein translocase subunit SecD
MLVRARRVAVVAGLLAGIYLALVVAIRGVPDPIVALFGGPDGGVARYGGQLLRYRPPAGYDATRFQRSIERNGATVRREGPALVVSVPGVSEAAADRMAELITHGGLEFREALEDPSLLLDFNRAGAERFGEITERLVGHKLATMLGGVCSPPRSSTARSAGGVRRS